jgi:carbonic anhydrase
VSRFYLFIMMGLLTASASGAQEIPRWSYDDDYTGQEEWGALSKDYSACELGTQQSPVQIAYTKTADIPFLDMHYAKATGEMHYDGRIMEIAVDNGHTLTMEGDTYRLETIQLHSPAEHVIRNDFYPLEIELLHENVAGKKLIVAVFAKLGDANPALAPVIEHAPAVGKSSKVIFDLSAWLPAGRGYYAYTGSLTTPPCTEGIEWRIFKQPIVVSKEQLDVLGRIIGRNARLLQPIYMRTVRETKG